MGFRDQPPAHIPPLISELSSRTWLNQGTGTGYLYTKTSSSNLLEVLHFIYKDFFFESIRGSALHLHSRESSSVAKTARSNPYWRARCQLPTSFDTNSMSVSLLNPIHIGELDVTFDILRHKPVGIAALGSTSSSNPLKVRDVILTLGSHQRLWRQRNPIQIGELDVYPNHLLT